jgi:hypothetical protein
MADQHIPRIICDPGAENEFAISEKWFIDDYVAGDWNGAAGSVTQWYSDTIGSQADIVAPAVPGGIHVSHTSWKDIKNTGALIYADDGTSFDLGNNSGIVFPASQAGYYGGYW